jgi:uncharacterized protein with PIN domain
MKGYRRVFTAGFFIKMNNCDFCNRHIDGKLFDLIVTRIEHLPFELQHVFSVCSSCLIGYLELEKREPRES